MIPYAKTRLSALVPCKRLAAVVAPEIADDAPVTGAVACAITDDNAVPPEVSKLPVCAFFDTKTATIASPISAATIAPTVCIVPLIETVQ